MLRCLPFSFVEKIEVFFEVKLLEHRGKILYLRTSFIINKIKRKLINLLITKSTFV